MQSPCLPLGGYTLPIALHPLQEDIRLQLVSRAVGVNGYFLAQTCLVSRGRPLKAPERDASGTFNLEKILAFSSECPMHVRESRVPSPIFLGFGVGIAECEE